MVASICPKCKTVLTSESCAKCGYAAQIKTKKAAATKGKPESATKPKSAVNAEKPGTNKTKSDDVKAAKSKSKLSAKASEKQGSWLLPALLLGGGAVVLLLVLGGSAVAIWWGIQPPTPAPVTQGKQTDGLPDSETPATDKPAPVERKPNPPPTPVQEKSHPLPADGRMTTETLAKVRDATVLIHVGLSDGRPASGSGFLVEEPGIVCTNAHVLGMLEDDGQTPKRTQVVIRSGEAGEKTLNASVLALDRKAGAAVLRVESTPRRLAAGALAHEKCADA